MTERIHVPGCETFEQLLKTFGLSRGMLGEIMSAYEFLDSECMRLLNAHLKLPNPISGRAAHTSAQPHTRAATRVAPSVESGLPLCLSARLSLLHRHRDVRIRRRARRREAPQLPGRCDDIVAGYRWDRGDRRVKNKGVVSLLAKEGARVCTALINELHLGKE